MEDIMTQEEIRITGDHIKEYRKQRGLTQQDLAEILGVSLPTVKRWENNKTTPRDTSLLSLMGLFAGSAASTRLAPNLTFAASALGSSALLGPLGPIVLGAISLAGLAYGTAKAKTEGESQSAPDKEEFTQKLRDLREQMINQLPIPTTKEQRTKVEKDDISVKVDSVLAAKFREEADIRGFTESRLLESILWLFLETPPLSFQGDAESSSKMDAPDKEEELTGK
jgi:transcriptional regulator with XRE-family HTH domain